MVARTRPHGTGEDQPESGPERHTSVGTTMITSGSPANPTAALTTQRSVYMSQDDLALVSLPPLLGRLKTDLK